MEYAIIEWITAPSSGTNVNTQSVKAFAAATTPGELPSISGTNKSINQMFITGSWGHREAFMVHIFRNGWFVRVCIFDTMLLSAPMSM